MSNLDYIDDYFNGQPTAIQKADFEQKILAEPSFAEEVAFYINTQALLRQQVEEEKKGLFREIYEQNKASIPLTSSRPLYKIGFSLAAAAVVLVIFTGLWWVFLRQPTPHQLADKYLQELPISIQMGSRQDSLQIAKNSYIAKDFPTALRQFEQMIERDSADETALRFAGLACLRLNEYDKALRYFQQLERVPGLYSNPAKFYQALTLMERNGPGDIPAARQLLEQVVAGDLDEKKVAEEWLKKW